MQRVHRRSAPLIATLAFVFVGMNFSILWHGFTAHSFSYWMTPPDLWGTYLGSDALVQGHPAQMYSQITGLNAFPAIMFALAPITAIGHALHLEAGQPFQVYTAPNAWIILGPFELLLCSFPLFALDAAAERFGLAKPRRLAMALFGAALLGPIAIRWGHPEDCIAVGLFLYAALDARSDRWQRSAWLMGLAIAFQPLVIVGLGALLATRSFRQFVRSVPALLLPSLVFLAAPLIASWHATTEALFNQPNFPTLNHATPWTGLFHHSVVNGVTAVSSGPARIVIVVIAVLAGAVVCRTDQRLATLLVVTEAAIILRVMLEPVLDPYYVWPALAIGLVLAARRSWARLNWAGGIALVATWWSGVHGDGVWGWWFVLLILLLLVLAMGLPWSVRAMRTVGQSPALATNG